MACNFSDVILDASVCESDFGGVGDRVYLFNVADLTERPSQDDIKDDNTYDSTAFNTLRGKLYAVDIRENSGQVTSQKSENGDGFAVTGTFVVHKHLDEFAALARTLSLVNFGCFIPDNKGKYYVLYSEYKRTKFGNAFDSGTTYDSEHGHTVTVEVAPMEYPTVKFAPADNLDDWLASNQA